MLPIHVRNPHIANVNSTQQICQIMNVIPIACGPFSEPLVKALIGLEDVFEPVGFEVVPVALEVDVDTITGAGSDVFPLTQIVDPTSSLAR
jgi:hypothetical protein